MSDGKSHKVNATVATLGQDAHIAAALRRSGRDALAALMAFPAQRAIQQVLDDALRELERRAPERYGELTTHALAEAAAHAAGTQLAAVLLARGISELGVGPQRYIREQLLERVALALDDGLTRASYAFVPLDP